MRGRIREFLGDLIGAVALFGSFYLIGMLAYGFMGL